MWRFFALLYTLVSAEPAYTQQDHIDDFKDFDLNKDDVLDALEIRWRYRQNNGGGIADTDLVDFFVDVHSKK